MALFEQGVLIVQNGLGYEELTVTSSPSGLQNVPEGNSVRRVVIQSADQPIRWLAFPNCAASLDASSGLKLDAEDVLVYDGRAEDIRFVLDNAATGNGLLLIHYFGA